MAKKCPAEKRLISRPTFFYTALLVAENFE
jgi:hypothetical protein